MNTNQFQWPIRVYYEDTDAGGVVYHTGYLRFFERARTERLRTLGFEQDELRTGEGVIFAVKSMSVDFIKPARFNDLLWVDARVIGVKQASLIFAQTICRQNSARELLCSADVRVVCLEADTFKATAIPAHLLQRIKDEL